MGGGTTQIDNETKENEADDGDDLDGCEPELAFTECTGTQKVDGDNDGAGYGNPHGIEFGVGIPVCERLTMGVISVDYGAK